MARRQLRSAGAGAARTEHLRRAANTSKPSAGSVAIPAANLADGPRNVSSAAATTDTQGFSAIGPSGGMMTVPPNWLAEVNTGGADCLAAGVYIASD